MSIVKTQLKEDRKEEAKVYCKDKLNEQNNMNQVVFTASDKYTFIEMFGPL